MLKYLLLSFIFGTSLMFGKIDLMFSKIDILEEQNKKIQNIIVSDNLECHYSTTVRFYQEKAPDLLRKHIKKNELLAHEGNNIKKQKIQEELNGINTDIIALIADGEFILGHSHFKDN